MLLTKREKYRNIFRTKATDASAPVAFFVFPFQLITKAPDGLYIWRTVEDDKVRGTHAAFTIKEDGQAGSEAPWYEDVATAKEAFRKYDIFVAKAAEKHKIDPDLIRAIMWAENTRGGYMGAGYRLDDIGISRTIMPMNIYRDIWFSLISQDKTDLYDPEKNIEAGAILLKRIQARIINPTPEKIAAVWEYIGAEKTSDYPAYIARVYRKKPWIRK